VDALHLLGVCETQLGRALSGLHWIGQSLALNPQQPVALTNQGNALLALKRWDAALAVYEQALRLLPEYALALYGCGNALAALGRNEEALANYDRTLTLSPGFLAALTARGRVLLKLQRYGHALIAFDQAIELAAASAQAHLGRASALLGLKRYAEGLRSIDRALQLAPNLAAAYAERGHLLGEQGETDAAIAAYDRALQLDPDLASAWSSRGLALSLKGRHADAAVSLRRALQVDRGQPYARGAALHAQLQICDWTEYTDRVHAVVESVRRGEPAEFPFSFLAVCDSPALQLQCARRFALLQGPRKGPLWTGERYSHGRLRIAYVSADFLDHPTAYLMAGVFEKHDRSRFETVAISLRQDRDSAMTRRIKAAFERWFEVDEHGDQEIAQLIRSLEIDIVVDLMGYTGEHRVGIYAYRPAPIQVNYLGFPGTMGTSDIDYLIADHFLIPAEHRPAYSESIVYLPGCFQANDDCRLVAAEKPTRAQLGLPETGFVWSSFHSSYKLNPAVFEIWTRLLLAVPGSVLWLFGGTATVVANLRREAQRRGLDAERLLFAGSLPYPEHLARLSLADLCLDTFPFNGGATASDALWAGVPLLTYSGNSMAARMAGSLLHAMGLAELVTDSPQRYEQLALQLATTPGRLAEIRGTLARNRNSSDLFATDRFRRRLEYAYVAMMARHGAGLPAATLEVPVLPPC
jgi:predicted O-linked N-acetylglucosamine transferase (SPINDLY family)